VTELKITSRKNPLLQQVKKLLSSRKAREEAGLFVSDGTKLLAEAVNYYPGLDTVILPARPEHLHISSTMVREMLRYRQKLENYVPAGTAEILQKIGEGKVL